MIVLAAVFGATWFVSTAMAAHLPRLLEAMGASAGDGDLRRLAGGPGASRGASGGIHLAAKIFRR